MKSHLPALRHALAVVAVLAAGAAAAQNIAIVNGKPVPKARVDTLIQQAEKAGQAVSPEMQQQARDQVVLREIFTQEAERRGLQTSADYKAQMEVARQSLLIRELFNDYQKTAKVSDDELKAEYDKVKGAAAGGGNEFHARHILVEKEEEAKALIAQLKAGAKFEDLAKANSKDPGSAPNGGDLDWAAPGSYVPEFSQAMVKLQKGQFTDEPVKSQFGYHIIRLDDTRTASFPSFEEVKPQLAQRAQQQKLAKFRDDLKNKAKTDYKFSAQ